MRSTTKAVVVGVLAVQGLSAQAQNWAARVIPNTSVSVSLPSSWITIKTAGKRGGSSSEVKQYKVTIGSVGVLAVVTKAAKQSDATIEKLQEALASRMTYQAANGDSSTVTSMKILNFKGKRILRGAALFRSKSGNQNIRVIAYVVGTQTVIVNIGYAADDRKAYEIASKVDRSFDIR